MRTQKLLLLSLAFTVLFFSQRTLAAVILQYHHVTKDAPEITRIDPELFEAHLDYLEKHKYQIWSLPKLAKYLNASTPVPDKVVVITFDDAYSSIYDIAYPMLKRKGWPFTVFVATDPVDNKIKSFMSWAQLKTLSQNGGTIANHTQGHTHLVRRKAGENKVQWLERIKNEIQWAQMRITQEIGTNDKLLAYPYGEYDKDIEELVASLGYMGFGQQSGAVNHQFPLTAIPRFPMNNNYGKLEEFKVKIASLPLPAMGVTPPQRIIRENDTLAKGIEFKFRRVDGITDQLNCYLSGKGKLETRLTQSKDSITVKTQPIPPLSPGRSRINCTMPTTSGGRFYWFSHFFMKPLPSGQWYDEP